MATDDLPAHLLFKDEWATPILGEIAAWEWREQNELCPMCSEPAEVHRCGAVFCLHCGYENDCDHGGED